MRAQRIRPIVAFAVAGLALAACDRSRLSSPVITGYDRSSIVESVDFWHKLPERVAVTNDEGLHGLILFADGDDPNKTYAQRVEYLRALGWLRDGFDEPADLAMQRGTLAKGLAHALDIEGGVMMRLTDRNPRYSTRELIFMGLMPPGTEQQVLNGYQYIGVISEAQDYELLKQGENIQRVPPAAAELDEADDNASSDETAPSAADG